MNTTNDRIDTAMSDNVRGYTPLQLDDHQTIANIAADEYEVDKLLGDIIMAEYVDENAHGEVNRNGIWVKEDIGTKLWRTAKVIKIGPLCPKEITEGCFVRFPSDKGIKGVFLGKKYIFLNAERIFCVVKQVSK